MCWSSHPHFLPRVLRDPFRRGRGLRDRPLERRSPAPSFSDRSVAETVGTRFGIVPWCVCLLRTSPVPSCPTDVRPTSESVPECESGLPSPRLSPDGPWFPSPVRPVVPWSGSTRWVWSGFPVWGRRVLPCAGCPSSLPPVGCPAVCVLIRGFYLPNSGHSRRVLPRCVLSSLSGRSGGSLPVPASPKVCNSKDITRRCTLRQTFYPS